MSKFYVKPAKLNRLFRKRFYDREGFAENNFIKYRAFKVHAPANRGIDYRRVPLKSLYAPTAKAYFHSQYRVRAEKQNKKQLGASYL